MDEAYEKYALTANALSTGLATFRAIVRKYPHRAPNTILSDLAIASGEPGRWFAAAKDAGFLDLALQFANAGRTDPRTLSRASRDFLRSDPRFSLEVGRLAIQRILDGFGYELTAADVIDAYHHLMAAAIALGVSSQTLADMLALANQPGAAFSEVLIRQCSRDRPQADEAPQREAITEQRIWTRKPTRPRTSGRSRKNLWLR